MSCEAAPHHTYRLTHSFSDFGRFLSGEREGREGREGSCLSNLTVEECGGCVLDGRYENQSTSVEEKGSGKMTTTYTTRLLLTTSNIFITQITGETYLDQAACDHLNTYQQTNCPDTKQVFTPTRSVGNIRSTITQMYASLTSCVVDVGCTKCESESVIESVCGVPLLPDVCNNTNTNINNTKNNINININTNINTNTKTDTSADTNTDTNTNTNTQTQKYDIAFSNKCHSLSLNGTLFTRIQPDISTGTKSYTLFLFVISVSVCVALGLYWYKHTHPPMEGEVVPDEDKMESGDEFLMNSDDEKL